MKYFLDSKIFKVSLRYFNSTW